MGYREKKEYRIYSNTVYFHKSANGKLYPCSLFGHPFYYLQNSSTDNSINRECVKALLWLHTLPFNYYELSKIFKFSTSSSLKNGGIEALPLGFVLFVGGLIWRKRVMDLYKSDPIIFKYVGNEYESKYYNPTNNDDGTPSPDPLLYNDGNNSYFIISEEKSLTYNMKYNNIVSENIEYYTENIFINRFLKFVSNEWVEIKEKCELNFYLNYTGKSEFLNYEEYQLKIKKALVSTDENYLINRVNVYNDEFITDENNESFKLINLKENYFTFLPSNVSNRKYHLWLFYKDDNPVVKMSDKMLNEIIIVAQTGVNHKNRTVPNKLDKGNVKTYVTSFIRTLKSLLDKNDKVVETLKANIDPNEKTEMDYKLAIYMYCKHLWDAWFSGIYYSNDICCLNNDSNKQFEYRDIFNVKNYFENFIFVDSFYRNTFQRIRLNCNNLLDYYKGVNSDKNLFNVLGDIASSVNCMFLSIPDFVCIGDGNDTDAYKNIESIFKPMPTNKVPLPSLTNKFVCMYTHRPSEIATNDKGFKSDSFDIWSETGERDSCAPPILKKPCEGFGDDDPNSVNYKLSQMNRYGYNVPSFGIAYSRQQNSIFKNIKISMNNPAMTEAAIRSYAAIVEQGNSSAKKVCFYGQDLYNVYSNYSYIVEVEMMGDAQIQPLMYFQLMNIPMFRGTYMIMSVTHNISQGNMTTTFKGFKMSKYCVPYTSNWFSLSIPEDEAEGSTPVDCESSTEEDYSYITHVDSAITTEEQNKNGLIIMKSLVEEGFSFKGKLKKLNKYQACAIAGNYWGESGWNPKKHENGKGSGYGLAQWTYPTRCRITDKEGTFSEFMTTKHYTDDTLEKWSGGKLNKQLEFQNFEFGHHSFRGLWGTDISKSEGNLCAYDDYEFNNSATTSEKEFDDNLTAIKDMALKFCYLYENPDRDVLNLEKRLEGAKKAFVLYNDSLSPNKPKDTSKAKGEWSSDDLKNLTQDDLMRMLCVITKKERYALQEGLFNFSDINGTYHKINRDSQLHLKDCIYTNLSGIHIIINREFNTNIQTYNLFVELNYIQKTAESEAIKMFKMLYDKSKSLKIPASMTLKQFFEFTYLSGINTDTYIVKDINHPFKKLLSKCHSTEKNVNNAIYTLFDNSGIIFKKMRMKKSDKYAEFWTLCDKAEYK